MPLDEPIDIDRELTLTLPGSSVYCFDGIEGNTEWPVYPDPVLPGEVEDSLTEIDSELPADSATYDLQGRRVMNPTLPGLYIRDGNIIKLYESSNQKKRRGPSLPALFLCPIVPFFYLKNLLMMRAMEPSPVTLQAVPNESMAM